jgi:very-short-patch-repair endonuclease
MSWAETARRQAGVISRAQLREAGVSDDRVDHMLVTGALVERARGVHLVRGAPDGIDVRRWTAVLATEGVLGFASAAHLWGMDDEPDRVHVIVGPYRRVVRLHGLRRHHVTAPRRAVTQLDGLPVTTRSWSLMDHVGRMPVSRGLRLVDRGIQQGWLTSSDIARRLAEYPGRQGNRALRIILSYTSDGAAAASERALHRILRRAGVAGWRPNFEVRLDGAVVAVVDVAVPAAKLAIEVDGFAFHSDVDRFQRDRQRQNTLVALGWTVLRFTWHDLVERPSYVAATIRAQLSRS